MASPFNPKATGPVATKGIFCGNIQVVFDYDANGFQVGSCARVMQDGNEIKDVSKIVINIEPESVITVDMEIIPSF